MFKQVLQNDEEILFEEGVNKKAFIKKGLLSGIGLSAFISCFPAQFITIACAMITDGGKGIMIVWPISWAIIFVIGIILSYVITKLESKNTYFAVTNKRIIKRYGAFNNKYVHYSLKNVGTVMVSGSIFDTDESANLIVSVKDFHMNTDGHTSPLKLTVKSLNRAYEAYNVLSEKVEGNNEVLRIKSE